MKLEITQLHTNNMHLSELMLGESYSVESFDNTGRTVYLGVLIEKRIMDVNNDQDCEYVFSHRTSLEDTEESYIICTLSEHDENALEIIHTDRDLPELEKPRPLRRQRDYEPVYYNLKEFFVSSGDILAENTNVVTFAWN